MTARQARFEALRGEAARYARPSTGNEAAIVQAATRVEVHVINRPGQPFLGTGEAAQGPAAAALANAVADATGVRIREIPFSAARVRDAIGL